MVLWKIVPTCFLLVVSFCFNNTIAFGHGTCTGSGTYLDPYVYTSPVDTTTKTQYIIIRGQTITSSESEVVDQSGLAQRISDSCMKQIDERIDKATHNVLGLITVGHVGGSTDLDEYTIKTQSGAQWVETANGITETSGEIVQFQSPSNPPEVVGVVKITVVTSKMQQDVYGVEGDLDVSCTMTKPNPNSNNDPLAEDMKFAFAFDFGADSWEASVTRKVDGNQDIDGTDSGTWNPYGSGTMINLPNPGLPLSGVQTDWYLDGQNADDAWTLVNNIHYHPGPLSFGFEPFDQAYIEQYCP